MVKILIAIDNIQNKSADSKTLEKIISILKNAGHTVESCGVGPNKIQRYAQSHDGDIMVQVAGGKCFGTLGDFYIGTGRNGQSSSHYYKPSKFGFMYFQCYRADWPCKREPRDHFSGGLNLSRWQGKSLKWVLEDMGAIYGYGDTAEACANSFLKSLGGLNPDSADSTTNTSGGGGGGTAMDLIKQAISPLDKEGVEVKLVDDTVIVRKTRIDDTITIGEDMIVNNSISYDEYDSQTPNRIKGTAIQDSYLTSKYGVVETEVETKQPTQLDLQLAQRGHGHSIDMKVLYKPEIKVGRWVKLNVPSLSNINRYYYITKVSNDDSELISITLEPAPPSRYVEVTETNTDDTTSEEESSEEDTSEDS